MQTNKKTTIVLITGVVLAGALIWWWQGDQWLGVFENSDSLVSINDVLESSDLAEEQDSAELREEIASVIENESIEYQTHTSSNKFFSFDYPSDFSAAEFLEGDEAVVLLRTRTGRTFFQMRVAEFDEPGPITAERIREDIPDLVIENAQSVFIGGGQIMALLFNSEGEGQKTREVWFVGGGLLFQVSAQPNGDAVLGPILESLTF